jgi:hypothetical protein
MNVRGSRRGGWPMSDSDALDAFEATLAAAREANRRSSSHDVSAHLRSTSAASQVGDDSSSRTGSQESRPSVDEELDRRFVQAVRAWAESRAIKLGDSWDRSSKVKGQ